MEARLRNYASEFLSPKDILCEFDIDEKLAAGITNPEVRKNVLLIVKEAINNIAKYSSATNAMVSLRQQNQTILLSISDNGKGYAADNTRQGNGFQNMHQRCRQLNGQCNISSEQGNGVSVACVFPLAIISYKQ
ncbi:MAG: ATP-binding protein [Bacteroidota bacterium]